MDYRVGDEVLVKGYIKHIDGFRSDRVFIEIRTGGETVGYWIDASLISKPSTVIFDPTSPEAQALVGKEVEFSNCWDFNPVRRSILREIGEDRTFPFETSTDAFRFIRPIPQPETISREEAEKELEKALGKKVRIEG